ncbi:MAG: hypothetical protein JOY99_12870 [Sphingomonadaceae bacterium]|nr:hypothetical protein [Sphingomonadaceae bacterium]
MTVAAFPPMRAWRVVEVQPSLYRAELHERGRGVIYATGIASWPRIHRFLRCARGGLPVSFKELRRRARP